jgi:hypothetical protein
MPEEEIRRKAKERENKWNFEDILNPHTKVVVRKNDLPPYEWRDETPSNFLYKSFLCGEELYKDR